MYGDFLFDLFTVYQNIKPKLLLEAGEFMVYEGRPAIFWNLDLPEKVKSSLLENGFVVDAYTSDSGIKVLAQYTRERSTIHIPPDCMHPDLQLYCEYCDNVFRCEAAEHDPSNPWHHIRGVVVDGAKCPECGESEHLDFWGNVW